ncbi:MAG: hypothetical protein HW380_3192 [Magnetococcales bacterium]|nr:hypothetical protein [Magnetococcales bacterium]HIJ83395.1 hypothetical protein [Magnetococcales bacterium]
MEVVTLYAKQSSGKLAGIPFSLEWFEYQAFRPTDKVENIHGFPHATIRQFERTDPFSCDTVWVGEPLH